MGEKQAAPTFVMVALILFAAATPKAYGQGGLLGIVNQLTNGVNINVRVCCSSTGNCNSTTAGLSGVLVKVTCTTSLLGTSVTVGQGVTGVTGNLNISIPNLLSTLGTTTTNVLNGGLPCLATINLPLSQAVCPVLNTATGILVGVPVLATSFLTPVVGTLANATVVAFINIKA